MNIVIRPKTKYSMWYISQTECWVNENRETNNMSMCQKRNIKWCNEKKSNMFSDI